MNWFSGLEKPKLHFAKRLVPFKLRLDILVCTSVFHFVKNFDYCMPVQSIS